MTSSELILIARSRCPRDLGTAVIPGTILTSLPDRNLLDLANSKSEVEIAV